MAPTQIEKKKVYAQGIAGLLAGKASAIYLRDGMKVQFPELTTQIDAAWAPVLTTYDSQVASLRAARDAIVVNNADRVAYAQLDEAAANSA